MEKANKEQSELAKEIGFFYLLSKWPNQELVLDQAIYDSTVLNNYRILITIDQENRTVNYRILSLPALPEGNS